MSIRLLEQFKMSSNLSTIIHNREISSKKNYRRSIDLLLESSYFANSDEKHMPEDFSLPDSGYYMIFICIYLSV